MRPQEPRTSSEERTAKKEELTVAALQWIYITPSAFQVFAHFTSGLVLPGILGILANNWRNLTHWIWSRLAGLVSIPFEGMAGVYDVLTLSAFIFLAALGAKLRKGHGLLSDTRGDYSAASFFQKRTISLRMSALCMAYIIVFSFRSMMELYGDNYLRPAAVLYPISFILVFVGCEYYFGFSREAVAAQIEKARSAKQLSLGALYVPAALALRGFIFASWTIVLLMIYYLTRVPPDRSKLPFVSPEAVFIAQVVALWILMFWLSHLRFNWPPSAKLAKDLEHSVRILLVISFMMGPLLPFLAGAASHAAPENKAWVGGLGIIGSLLLSVSFLYMIRTSWRVARNILVVFSIFMLADQILGWLAKLARGVSPM